MIVLATLIALAAPVQASKASGAAKDFSLDLGAVPADETVTAPATPAEAAPVDDTVTKPADPAPIPAEASAPPPEETPPAPAPVAFALFGLDTPIGALVADPRARAVLDKNLPGLSTDENLPKFRALSLRKFQPLTGGQLTDDLLKQTETDLAAIKPSATRKRRLDSR